MIIIMIIIIINLNLNLVIGPIDLQSTESVCFCLKFWHSRKIIETKSLFCWGERAGQNTCFGQCM